MALLGVSGRSFDQWLQPGIPPDFNQVTQIEFVGPKTSQPDQSIYPNDWNNIGPAVGFAWALPWFGEGKTNIRGGYQISYIGGGHAGNLSNFIFNTPGFVNNAQTQGPIDGTPFDTRSLPGQIPIAPSSLPMQPIPIQKQNFNAAAFDPNYRTPYIQNYTLSITREVTRNLTLDVRYIGTRGIALTGFYDLNAPNVFYNQPLFDAFERTRRGEDVELFDQMFMGLNFVTGLQPVNGTTSRGSAQLRQSTTFRDALANGDYFTLANSLNVFNGTGTGVVTGASGERGTVLRRANKGINVAGGATVAGVPAVPAGLFPENYISANPQFAQSNYWTNSGKSNYHSMQVQGTLRPSHGLNVQGTYVWSRSLETPLVGSNLANGLSTTPAFTNPAEREKDYGLSPNHVTHDFRGFGTYELPLGPGKLLFRDSSGALARIAEGWQTSFIVNLSTGQPVSIASTYLNGTTVSPTGLYAASVPDVVGPFPVKGFGKVDWNGDFGNFFGNRYGKTADPQCAGVETTLRQFCTLQAVTDTTTGQIVLQNPLPGKRGTLGRQTLEMPATWGFDAALSKTIRVAEAKTVQVRVDATNVFNHPQPNLALVTNAPPAGLNINSTVPFGFIQDKGNPNLMGSEKYRQFKATVRFNF